MQGIWGDIVRMLERTGPRLYAGVPGDDPDIIDAARAAGARYAALQDQRSAAFAAVGWSRLNGRAAVLATAAGPNLLNALIGISEAYTSRTPLLVLSTTTRDTVVGRGGFQEFPAAALSEGLFVWTHRVASAADLAWAVSRARYLAEHGRRGPVHLMISPELTEARVSEEPVETSARQPMPPGQSAETLAPVFEALRAAERPVLVFGGGTRQEEVAEHGLPLAAALNALCLVTASGRGVFPEDHPRFGGLAGLYLPEESRAALAEADAVVVLGSQLEETALMGWAAPERAHLAHVDTDPAVLDRAVPARYPVVCDSGVFLRLAADFAGPPTEAAPWWRPWQPMRSDAGAGLGTVLFWTTLREALQDQRVDVLTQENGLADLWGYYAPCFTLPPGVRPLVPSEQTPLGFGLGAALGAAADGRRVVAVGGDGAFLTNLPSLLAAARTEADICYICLDNGGFGWPSLSRTDTAIVDFAAAGAITALAEAAGCRTAVVSEPHLLAKTLGDALAGSGPRLVVVRLADRPSFPPDEIG
ncbi:thiamine pyrophosphate-dependent enzyme [Nocardia sp. XZ_19_369]|uniref:thiamine pyrophosphate-dependent enzyme n=1 Tax=Nocardia sp. XZ_19_369 TaxID=2769487 RepID=UPI00188E9881|nr:thiamine pyrophosphate-dependent enzyme [Nocardia sp. XZ_19_369]